MTEDKNFSGQQTPSIIDIEYRRCNFSQPAPVDTGGEVYVGVRLFPGDDTPRTFIGCNLCNAEFPPGSVIEECNTTIARRNVETDVDTVTISGEPVVLQHHADYIYGRLMLDGTYEYKSVPDILEVD